MSRSTHCCPARLGRPTSSRPVSDRLTRMLPTTSRLLVLAALPLTILIAASEPAQSHWFKGNLHTHSLWSDGDDYPEMIADRYKQAGYHFLALSDHNVLAQGTRWLELKPPALVNGMIVQRGGGGVLDAYLARFGPRWVEQRDHAGHKEVRLKPLAEYRTLLEEPDRFLLIPSAEITSSWKHAATATEPERSGPVHMNHTNPVSLIAAVPAESALEVMQKSVDEVRAQQMQTGQSMLIHLNHPNYIWGVTAEELMQVRGEKFFEVYNGHASVHNGGDATHLGTEEMWDAILTRRLAELGLGVMYGLGTDDAHHYHQLMIGQCNPFRGWIMVRATHLTPESIIRAMEAGDFYASSGVTLADVTRTNQTLAITIQAEPGVTYTTQFVGTRRGYDRSSRIIGEPGKTLQHRRYSKDVGAVLAEAHGLEASYTLKGDEIYVRARITSSKPKLNASTSDEVECAWTQPLVNESQPAN
jgi:hypothetical protein